MMSSNGDSQEKLNRLNDDLRKEMTLIDNLVEAEKRDIERVKHRYGNDIERHKQTIKRLTHEIEHIADEIRRSKK